MSADIEQWTCSICYDSFSSPADKPCKIPHDENTYYFACANCLRVQFLLARENEINYPVKWQRTILHPRQFPTAFNGGFDRAYETKEKEYQTPALQRVYCECGMFVAPMVAAHARASWVTLASSKLCPSCEARWCLRCAQRCGGYGVPHECVPQRRLGERRLALGGLKKGKDFQICPGETCGKMIELAEACNAIYCQCGTEFCYVCGEQVSGGSDHWLKEFGGCPRYGVVGSGREMFDDDFGHLDDGDNDDGLADDDETGPFERWERGEGESTTFDLIRWAWQAAMAEGTVYTAQLDLMFGDEENEEQLVDEVHRAMEMYHPVNHSGISEERWQELVEQQGDAIEDWLVRLHEFVRSGTGIARDYLGGTLLDFVPRNVFNMAITEDQEAAALWVQRANAATIDLIQNPHGEYPGSAVFDVGPGGPPGQSWRIRNMPMFEGLPALGFYKLAGGALLVRPRPVQALNHLRELQAGNQRALQDDASTQREGDFLRDEDHELDAHIIEVSVRIVAGERIVRVHLGTMHPLFVQSHPVESAVLRPFAPLGYFIINDLFNGIIGQEAYDEEYGLEFREYLQIPGSWPGPNDLNELLYNNILAPGWYSQDVFVMRSMIMVACWMYRKMVSSSVSFHVLPETKSGGVR